jgi:uncharacterized protein (DUF111 family)
MPSWNIEKMCVLEANIDDCTAEHLAFCVDRLLQEGAADAWVAPIIMKKGRAAHTLHCLFRVDEKDKFLEIVFRHSTTLGVRVQEVERVSLPRKKMSVHYISERTSSIPAASFDGDVDVKVGYLGNDIVSIKAEFDHCKAISLATGEPIQEVSAQVVRRAKAELHNTEKELASSLSKF